MNIQLHFTIINDMGNVELEQVKGLPEVFTLFWKHFANAMTVGERERAPFVRHVILWMNGKNLTGSS